MKEIKTFEVVVKEKLNDHPIKTSYTGVCEREDVIDFYGLREPDVEWFTVKEITNNTEEI
jgi:hypothetical protein